MTKHSRQIRVIKRDQRSCAEVDAGAEAVAAAEPSEREMKTVVSGWVSEHRQKAEEFRRAFTGLLREAGFNPTRATSRA